MLLALLMNYDTLISVLSVITASHLVLCFLVIIANQ